MLLACARIDSKGEVFLGQTVPRVGLMLRDCCDFGCFQIVEVSLLSSQMTIVRIGDNGRPVGKRRVVDISPEWIVLQSGQDRV